ncbi:MAG: hypothetical protein M9958_00390 [Chitinophagales bacterium]|nr:hypothetical protein [Chitinophagales bacterium]
MKKQNVTINIECLFKNPTIQVGNLPSEKIQSLASKAINGIISKSQKDYKGLKEVMEKIKSLSQAVIDELNTPAPNSIVISDLAIEEMDKQTALIESIVLGRNHSNSEFNS